MQSGAQKTWMPCGTLLLVGILGPTRNIAAAQSPTSVSGSQIILRSESSQKVINGAREHFTGAVRVQPLFDAKDQTRSTGGQVTFQPRARSAWHTHPLGQILIVTDGIGWFQQSGGPIRVMRKGDVIWIPAGAKHWHGATPTRSVTHIAIQENLDGRNVDWLEKVSDEQYRLSK